MYVHRDDDVASDEAVLTKNLLVSQTAWWLLGFKICFLVPHNFSCNRTVAFCCLWRLLKLKAAFGVDGTLTVKVVRIIQASSLKSVRWT